MPENEINNNQMTQEEYDRLEARLSEMKNVKAKEIADALKEARSYGDLSENAEYDAAKENEAKFREELQALEQRLNNAVIVEVDSDKVGVGLTVTVRDKDNKEDIVYSIVGGEVDPFANPPRISISSPIGTRLNGRSVGDVVEVEVPNGVRHFEVKKIEKTKSE